LALATEHQGPVRKQAFAVARNDDLIRPCEQSEAIRLGLRICGLVWIASLSLAMTTSSIRVSVSGSGARFLPRFVTFQGLAARKIFRTVSLRQIRRTRFRPARPEIPGARDGRRQRAKSAIRGSQPTNRRPKLYDRTSDEITIDEVERMST